MAQAQAPGVDWSGLQVPMKEPDAGGMTASAIASQQQAAPPGGMKADPTAAAYEQWYMYQQQMAAAAALAASSQYQQATAATFSDGQSASIGAASDMQAYPSIYTGAAAAASQMAQPANYYYAASDPNMMQFPLVTPTLSMQQANPLAQAAAAVAMQAQAGNQMQAGTHAQWQGALSPSRLAQAAQLHKGFGSTGHGAGQLSNRMLSIAVVAARFDLTACCVRWVLCFAEPGPRDRRDMMSMDSVDKGLSDVASSLWTR
jgi:hypothetical protein